MTAGTNNGLFTYQNLVHAIAGAAGSAVGMVVFYPLDTVRSRLQLEEGRKSESTLKIMADIASKEGVQALYRGLLPVVQSVCASNFVYFYVYHGLKSNKIVKIRNDLVLASIAGAINVLVTTPLWLVNTRLKMSGVTCDLGYTNLIDGLIEVAKKEGVLSLWAGTLPSLVLVSNPAIHMAVYQSVKRRVPLTDPMPGWVYFLMSAWAKIVATVVTYPVQLVQAKMRHGTDMPARLNTWRAILYLMKKHGILGLYKGIEAKLLQTVLTSALMFTTYEKIAAFVLRLLLVSRKEKF